MCSRSELRRADVLVMTRVLDGDLGSGREFGAARKRKEMQSCPGNRELEGLWTHLLSTAISFSMLLSFPLRAFLGMHLTANMRPVSRSWARTTSEKAPLQRKKRSVIHRQMVNRYIQVLLLAVKERNWDDAEKLLFIPHFLTSKGKFTRRTIKSYLKDFQLTFGFIWKRIIKTASCAPASSAPPKRLRLKEAWGGGINGQTSQHKSAIFGLHRTNQRVAFQCRCPFFPSLSADSTSTHCCVLFCWSPTWCRPPGWCGTESAFDRIAHPNAPKPQTQPGASFTENTRPLRENGSPERP